MKSNFILRFFVILFCLSISVQAERPHFIIMLADDLGWGDVSYHGSVFNTPNIDSIAERGVQLDQFYVQPVCSPTRAAFMTGRYPMRYGMQCGVVRPWASHGLPLDEQTLAMGLRRAGYTTAVVGKWHLGHHNAAYFPTNRGFDHFYGHYNGAIDYFKHHRDGGHDWHRDDVPHYEEGYSTDLMGQEAARIIENQDPNKPLFLYVPFNAVHSPFHYKEEDTERNAHIEDSRRRIFAAMTSSMDDAVGEIIAAADKHLPKDNTLIMFFSDNGNLPVGSSGGLRGNKSTIYEGGIRSTAVMAWEGVLEAGGMVREPMHVVDLYPTFLGLAGAKVDQKKSLDGLDVWPTLAFGKDGPHDFILFNVTPFHGAIRAGNWKLVHNGAANANVTSSVGLETWELFDIEKDPNEQKNIKDQRPRIFRRLKSQLDRFEVEAVSPNIPPNVYPKDFKIPKIWGYADSK